MWLEGVYMHFKAGKRLGVAAAVGRRFWMFTLVLTAVILGSMGTASGQPPRPVNSEMLIRAIRSRDVAGVKQALNSVTDLNLGDRYGHTHLGEAIRYRLPDVALELIRRGADVNLTHGAMSAPLTVAAEICSEDSVRYLLERGAKVNAKDPGGHTALLTASAFCKEGKVVQILLKAGADPNTSDDEGGSTPLIAAAQSGNVGVVEALIAAGADVDAMNKYGETAFSIARDWPFQTEDYVRICVLLLKVDRK